MNKAGTVLSFVLALMLLAVTAFGASAETAAAVNELEGTWIMLWFSDETIDTWTLTFGQDGNCSVIQTSGGDTVSREMVYTADGSNLTLDTMCVKYLVNGDILVFTDGNSTMVLRRETPSADPALDGAWTMDEFTTDNITAWTIVFDHGYYSLNAVISGDDVAAEGAYTAKDGILFLNDTEGTYQVEGSRLTISESGNTMILHKVTEEIPLDGTTWTMTEFDGEPLESYTITFEGGNCTVHATRNGEALEYGGAYTLEGTTFTFNGSVGTLEVTDGVMTLTDQGETMKLVQK